MLFADRRDAGQRLAKALQRFKTQRPAVLALPRGGVPVGFEIAQSLEAPLDLLLVRKIGHPLSPELAVGAIADGETIEKVIESDIVAELGVPQNYLDEEIGRQQREIEHRRQIYLGRRAPIDLRGRTALVVDDGIATGATMRAALRAARKRGPAKVVLAVPVAAASSLESLRPEADEIVCLFSPEDFGAVGMFYADFRPVEDQVVLDLLDRSAAAVARRDAGH
ncbi:MAG TPA: phosphoribosyltransferase family protein [Stellaceae bacterium]|nr:phosphoribosyltransferase family protein [Stellaceae bacterium]